MIKILLLVLAVLSPTVLSEDWAQVMSDMVDSMSSMEQEWVDVFLNTTESVLEMSDRILFTEDLILDMAQQIGVMADRIVDTEYIMSDLASECLGCEVGEQQQPSQVLRWGPMDAFEDLMEYAMELMEQMSAEMAGLVTKVDDEIGEMADRILETECQIMDMADQIGVMADRIVKTEEMMANATSECCGVVTYQEFFVQKDQASLAKISSAKRLLYPNDTCSEYRKNQSGSDCSETPSFLPFFKKQTLQMRQHHKTIRQVFASPEWSALKLSSTNLNDDEFNPLDPFSWMEEMCKVAMDAMFAIFQQCIDLCESGLDEIGNLADDILDMELKIADASLMIGDYADMIVEVEEMGLQMVGDVCSEVSLTQKVKALALKMKKGQLKPLDGKLPNQKISLADLPAIPSFKGKLTSDVGDLFQAMLDMFDLFTKMFNDMFTVISAMVDAVDELANDIGETSDKITEMMNQIVIMGDRITETIALMDALTTQCF